MTTKNKVSQAIAITAAVPLVIASIIFIYTLAVPTDILKDWTIRVPQGPFTMGQTIAIDSHYTKVRNVSGTAHRYIECKTVGSAYTRYPLSQAEANHAAGTRTGTGVFITIPNVPQTPAKCHISIVIDYRVYGYKNQTESANSPDFLVTK